MAANSQIVIVRHSCPQHWHLIRAGARQILARGLLTQDGGRQSRLLGHQILQGGHQSQVPHWTQPDARQSSRCVRQRVTLRATLRVTLCVSLRVTLCVTLRMTLLANLPVSQCESWGEDLAVTTD